MLQHYHSRNACHAPASPRRPMRRASMAATLAAKGITPASARRYMRAQWARLQRGQAPVWPR